MARAKAQVRERKSALSFRTASRLLSRGAYALEAKNAKPRQARRPTGVEGTRGVATTLQLVEGQGELPDPWKHLRAKGLLGGEPQDRQRAPEGALLCFVLK